MTQRILAYGANGAQMAAGTLALVDAGHDVRVFTRSSAGAERWKSAGVEAVIGDMADQEALIAASEGRDAVFLHVPLITDPDDDRNAYGMNALRAARATGIKKIVMNDENTMKKTAKTDHDWSRLDAMTDADIEAAALNDPDAQPLTDADFQRMERTPQIKVIRRALGLNQDEFALRYQIPVGTLRDWEQRRSKPDQAAQAYLKVIARDPEFVRSALVPGSP